VASIQPFWTGESGHPLFASLISKSGHPLFASLQVSDYSEWVSQISSSFLPKLKLNNDSPKSILRTILGYKTTAIIENNTLSSVRPPAAGIDL
jgi:hypothetical protein